MFQEAKRIPAPEDYTENFLEQKTDAAQKRYELIFPALQEERCITDERYRNALFKKIAEENMCKCSVAVTPSNPQVMNWRLLLLSGSDIKPMNGYLLSRKS